MIKHILHILYIDSLTSRLNRGCGKVDKRRFDFHKYDKTCLYGYGLLKGRISKGYLMMTLSTDVCG